MASAKQLDFRSHAVAYGRQLKLLNVIDRKAVLAWRSESDCGCKAKDVLAVVQEPSRLYPAPAFIRRDSGLEFITQALRRWYGDSETTTASIDPASPRQNSFAESFNS